jgi:hypothetical protein
MTESCVDHDKDTLEMSETVEPGQSVLLDRYEAYRMSRIHRMRDKVCALARETATACLKAEDEMNHQRMSALAGLS